MVSQESIVNIEKIRSLELRGDYRKALEISQEIAEKNKNNFFLQNLNGYILFKLNNFKLSKKYLINSIKLNKNFATSYYLLGLVNRQHNEMEDALENFIKAISINPNLKDAHYNIIQILSSFDPKRNLKHPYVYTNLNIEKIKFKYNENKFIEISEVKNFLKKSIGIVDKNLNKIDYPYMQIYRHNSLNLNCDRHFKIFNTYSIIPEFCFDCFKIVVEVEKMLDLVKLYFIFDNFYVGLKNNRKVMVEQRPGVSGKYKGLIYSKNLKELNEIEKNLQKIVKNNIGDNFSISTKRGCTEFSQKFPDYKEIKRDKNKMMLFNNDWKEKEKIIDGKIYNETSEESYINKFLSGSKLNDILVIKNWLKFAKKNKDYSAEL